MKITEKRDSILCDLEINDLNELSESKRKGNSTVFAGHSQHSPSLALEDLVARRPSSLPSVLPNAERHLLRELFLPSDRRLLLLERA